MLPGREADNWIPGEGKLEKRIIGFPGGTEPENKMDSRRGTEPEYIFIVHLVFLTSVRS